MTQYIPDLKIVLKRDYHWLYSRAKESPGNVMVNEINKLILEKISGQVKHYKSVETLCNIEDTVHYPREFLNSLSPFGLPPHVLMLKLGIRIKLLRNLSPLPNSCNGTRLLIKVSWDNTIVQGRLQGGQVGPRPAPRSLG